MSDQEVTPYASSDRAANKVCLQMWIGGPVERCGISATAYLSPANAEKLIRRIREALDELPREASAADLGIAA